MSNRGQESSTLNSTKQLLDELDALMEKMLALPVNTLDEPAPLPEEAARLPRVSATLTILESTPETEHSRPSPTDASALAGSPRHDEASTFRAPHSEFTLKTLARAMEEEALTSPARSYVPYSRHETPADEIPIDAIPPSILQVHVPEIQVLPLPPRPWSNLLIGPLLLINGLFDIVTYLLGPFGRWLRTGQGRSFLALLGLALTLLAAGWLVKDWMSWTE